MTKSKSVRVSVTSRATSWGRRGLMRSLLSNSALHVNDNANGPPTPPDELVPTTLKMNALRAPSLLPPAKAPACSLANHALQRTAPHVTAPASATAFPPTVQVPRRAPWSLSLGR